MECRGHMKLAAMEITLRYRSWTMVCAAILFVAALAAVVVFLVAPENPIGYLFGAVVAGAFSVLMLGVFFRERKRWRKTVVISQEGIWTEDGELLEAAAIDYCYLHLCNLFIPGGRGGSIDKSFSRMVVVFKDGRERSIDLGDYGISFKKAESFHLEVNAVPGMPLIKEPVIERF